MKVLFIVPYPTEGASNRLRVEQYLPYLDRQGISYRVRPFISRRFYSILYVRGQYVKKICYFLFSTLNRFFDIFRAFWFDAVFIHREAFPLGAPWLETIFRLEGKRVIFDFDDAIFLPHTSKTNALVDRFKSPQKIPAIIRMSDQVIAGNEYLKNYARQFNPAITVIPTPIDTDMYRADASSTRTRTRCVIGWIGSVTTQVYLETMHDVFKEVSRTFPEAYFKIIGGRIDCEGIQNIEYVPWRLETELDELRDLDIGIMPMPDNEWTKGKCAFKIILYMSLGIPTVSSPVGVNRDIVRDGHNGFLARDSREWIDKLSRLIREPKLRGDFAREGRRLVEELYSVKANAPKFINVLEKTHETV